MTVYSYNYTKSFCSHFNVVVAFDFLNWKTITIFSSESSSSFMNIHTHLSTAVQLEVRTLSSKSLLLCLCNLHASCLPFPFLVTNHQYNSRSLPPVPGCHLFYGTHSTVRLAPQGLIFFLISRSLKRLVCNAANHASTDAPLLILFISIYLLVHALNSQTIHHTINLH